MRLAIVLTFLTFGALAVAALLGVGQAEGQATRNLMVVRASAHNSSTYKRVVAVCPEGMIATGGGYNLNLSRGAVVVYLNAPAFPDEEDPPMPDADAWEARARETRDYRRAWYLNAWAICE